MPNQSDIDDLSPDSLRVLGALLDASDGNGDDFGLMIDAREGLGMHEKKFAGHVAQLGAFIEWREDLAKDSGVECNEVQYGLTAETIGSRDLVAKRIAHVEREGAK